MFTERTLGAIELVELHLTQEIKNASELHRQAYRSDRLKRDHILQECNGLKPADQPTVKTQPHSTGIRYKW
jgi:hypothetical protein